jgi:hypothetical protein
MEEPDFPAEFLQQVLNAMEHVEEIEKASSWTDSKWDTPPLCRIEAVREKAVNPETFKKFESVLHFMLLGIFGVGEEGRSRGRWVKHYLQDTTRDAAVLPYFRVPKADYDSSLRDLIKARELAQFHAEATQEYVKRLDKNIERALKDQFALEDFRSRAKGCETCDGKGYIEHELDDYCNMSRKDKRFQKRSGQFISGKYRTAALSSLCDDCQPDDKIDLR